MTRSETTLNNKPLKWYDRLASFCYEASAKRLVSQLRTGAPTVFREMINDLETPIAPEIEAEIAQYLRSPFQHELNPSDTLMPRMMEKHGITATQFAELERKQRALLQRRCNQCTAVSQCWQAMRANTDLETSENFCPNHTSFNNINH